MGHCLFMFVQKSHTDIPAAVSVLHVLRALGLWAPSRMLKGAGTALRRTALLFGAYLLIRMGKTLERHYHSNV